MISTASSPRSLLGIAWTTTILGSAAGTVRRDRTVSSISPGAVRVTVHSAIVPAPSVTSARSPTASRRTVAAWRPSAPVSVTDPCSSSSGPARKTGGVALP